MSSEIQQTQQPQIHEQCSQNVHVHPVQRPQNRVHVWFEIPCTYIRVLKNSVAKKNISKITKTLFQSVQRKLYLAKTLKNTCTDSRNHIQPSKVVFQYFIPPPTAASANDDRINIDHPGLKNCTPYLYGNAFLEYMYALQAPVHVYFEHCHRFHVQSLFALQIISAAASIEDFISFDVSVTNVMSFSTCITNFNSVTTFTADLISQHC